MDSLPCGRSEGPAFAAIVVVTIARGNASTAIFTLSTR
jgi:hypothetical protein